MPLLPAALVPGKLDMSTTTGNAETGRTTHLEDAPPPHSLRHLPFQHRYLLLLRPLPQTRHPRLLLDLHLSLSLSRWSLTPTRTTTSSLTNP
eukprot:1396803-Rhodomonas_salina.2